MFQGARRRLNLTGAAAMLIILFMMWRVDRYDSFLYQGACSSLWPPPSSLRCWRILRFDQPLVKLEACCGLAFDPMAFTYGITR